MAYNVTGIFAGNETGLLTIIQGTNEHIMGGWLGSMFLMGISLVFLIGFIFTTKDFQKSATATAFIAFSLGLSLLALDLIPPIAFFIAFILCGILVAISWER